MNNYTQRLNALGIEIPSILLPQNVNPEKWAVIACDQYTQDRGYWEKVKTETEGHPSTLNLIFPEVYLGDGGARNRIENIHTTMKNYLANGVFAEGQRGFMYIERDTPYQKKRRGLLAAIDLDQYDWKSGESPLIRCTEGTVPERLPPRMDIRRGAPLELPHVLLLIDDDTDSLLPQLGGRVCKKAASYNTSLMMNSGSVTGWLINEENDTAFITEQFEKLLTRSLTRYNGGSGKPFLFAVGDGNHSLAAAKGIWEECKATLGSEAASHPCRYALVEISNIYDPAIQFEPIHRLVINTGFDKVLSIFTKLPQITCRKAGSEREVSQFCSEQSSGSRFGLLSNGRYALIEAGTAGIATACIQPLLDSYAKDNPQLIDYIHDENELFRLADVEGNTGILLPPVQKSGLFKTVAQSGPLPRKSFSMGHSAEKRFYLECRSLV